MQPFPPPIPFTEPWEYELRFPRDPRGPSVARAALRTVLAAHGLDGLTGRAELLTSELATNSVRYSERAASVHLRWAHPVLRVSVRDTSPDPPVLRAPSAGDGRGRGLLLLDLLADRWGGGPGEGPAGQEGKAVWFELTWTGSPSPAPAAV